MRKVFCLAVYQDFSLAMQAIESILQNFGNSEIVVCLDGYSSDVFTSFCCERQIHLTLGPRLKTADNAGRWIERLLSAAVASTTADVVVKLDPDTVFLRPFEVDNPIGIVGNLRTDGTSPYIQGGCQILHRQTVSLILISRLLHDSYYCLPQFSYRRYLPPYLVSGEAESDEPLAANDVILSDVARRLNIPPTHWDECGSFTFQNQLLKAIDGLTVEELRAKFAVIHPVKNSCFLDLDVLQQLNLDLLAWNDGGVWELDKQHS